MLDYEDYERIMKNLQIALAELFGQDLEKQQRELEDKDQRNEPGDTAA